MKKSLIVLFCVFGLLVTAFGQEVQWASSVTGFSSEFNNLSKPKGFKASQVLGAPSVMKDFGRTPCAWSPGEPQSDEEQWIAVSFTRAIKIKQVIVSEVNNPGAIVKVTAFDTEGKSHELYTNDDPKPIVDIGRLFTVKLDKTTNYRVKSIEIRLNTGKVFGWNQIDAIGISAYDLAYDTEIELAEGMEDSLEVEKLGTEVNSKFDELCPVISADGKTLYFTRDFHPGNQGKEKNQDVWVARIRPDGSFSPAANIGSPINNHSDNALTSVTPDGQTVMLLNVYQPNGSMVKGISTSKKTTDGWAFPKKINIKDYYNRQNNAEYCLHASGKIMVLTVQRDDSYGDKDLYVCFKNSDGSWSKPRNLSNVVNTADSETSPFLAADGVSLYFSSAGHPGYGRNDMFVSRRLDDTWKNWSEPKNLGPILNSASWDAYYTIPASGEFAYYVSYQDRETKAEIYRAKLPEAIRPKPVVLVHGKVFNSSTKEVLGADIVYERLSDGKELGIAYSDPRTGEYSITLPAGETYGFLAKSNGYLSEAQNINLNDLETYQEIEQDLFLIPAKKGETVVLKNIFFAASSADLNSESKNELKRIFNFLRMNPTVKVSVGGHTNNACKEPVCVKLSTDRAKSIVDWLVKHGVDPRRLAYKGYGSKRPILPNTTREGLRANRRVDFTIIDF